MRGKRGTRGTPSSSRGSRTGLRSQGARSDETTSSWGDWRDLKVLLSGPTSPANGIPQMLATLQAQVDEDDVSRLPGAALDRQKIHLSRQDRQPSVWRWTADLASWYASEEELQLYRMAWLELLRH